MRLSNKTRTCVVLGNGPSLRGFDLHRLNGLATLGMNAAYRHWDQIGWYPSFYACLDDQLVKTHHAEIERMADQGLIEKFFLHGDFFTHHPERLLDPRFTTFEQTSEYWHNMKYESQHKEKLYDRPSYRMTDPSKITTGSHSVRYVVDQGFNEIYLLGIDLRYVEIIPEAEPTIGIGLRIRDTPRTNPNYFFDTYQKAGDLYNIPNPKAHDGRLHPDSFIAIKRDFERFSVDCKIFNSNLKSILSDEDVFPYRPIQDLLEEDALGSVVVPCNQYEVDDIVRNFKLWADHDFHPLLDHAVETHPNLVFIFNNRSGLAESKRIELAFEKYGMDRFFRSLVVDTLDLEGERDAYIRDYSQPVGVEGYKAGPNNQFFESARRMQAYGHFTFLMEVDCLAIRRGWLTQIKRLADQNRDRWVIGSAYRGAARLGTSYKRHINGNALYATGCMEFQDFLSNFWEPHTRRLIKDKIKTLAYDCALDMVFTDQIEDPSIYDSWKKVAHKFAYTEVIQNISAGSDLEKTDLSLISLIRRDYPGTYILHNKVAHRLMVEKLDLADAKGPEELDREARKNCSKPRLLLLDMTPSGNGTATGEIKANLLQAWPAEALLQIAKVGKSGLGIVEKHVNGYVERECDASEVRRAITQFKPDVILYRPVPDSKVLHEVAMAEITRLNLPLITWIMDDWPARMAAEASQDWATMGPDLHTLIARSATRLSISGQMSEAFVRRYGKPFIPIANGVDPADWPIVNKPDRDTFVIRYAGGIAKDMNRDSLLQIAAAVEHHVKAGKRIRFEISTQQWWLDQCRPLFKAYPSTRLEVANKPPADYRRWIAEADLLVICYNFDKASLRYVQHSMANKVPECLVSGTPILAYGPPEAATIKYLAKDDLAQIVTCEDLSALTDCLGRILASPDDLAQRATVARAVALQHHNIHLLRNRFFDIVRQTTGTRDMGSRPFNAPVPTARTDMPRATMSDSNTAALTLAAALLTGKISVADLTANAQHRASFERVQDHLGADHPAVVHLMRVIDNLSETVTSGPISVLS